MKDEEKERIWTRKGGRTRWIEREERKRRWRIKGEREESKRQE